MSKITFKHTLIYNDEPRPYFWKHPVKWWKWKPTDNLIGYCDLDDTVNHDQGDITISFPPLEQDK